MLIGLGVLHNSAREVGLEGAGIIRAVGAQVKTLSVGDHVMYMSSGCFATHVTLPEAICVRMDGNMSFEMAASLPCVFATAAMALVDKARLGKGQVRSFPNGTPADSLTTSILSPFWSILRAVESAWLRFKSPR